MTLKSRLQKLEQTLQPNIKQVHFVGWMDCEWSECDGLIRKRNESKELFFKRVRLDNPDKIIFWCD